MPGTLRPYRPDPDFLAVRDLLAASYGRYGRPVNWGIERWNYSRYFVTPMLAGPDEAAIAQAIAAWEASVGLWAAPDGSVAGVVCTEHVVRWHPSAYDVFIQHVPDHDGLLDEMLAYAEKTFAQGDGAVRVLIADDDAPLQAAAQARGYREDPGHTEPDSVYATPNAAPAPALPAGYRLRSMAEGGDLALRARGFGEGFNHPDPADWPCVASYASLLQAPDYHPDLDLYVVAPDGLYVSFCILWPCLSQRIAMLEPVGTHPQHRRRGLARTVVLEAIRRAAALGVEKVYVGSDQAFYRAVGFVPCGIRHAWVRQP